MAYWLMKSEPSSYSWEDMQRDGNTYWDGVRNYQARNNMKAMAVGDLAFFYRSVKKPAIMGIVKIVREAYQDPTTKDERWVVVDIELVETFDEPVTLAVIKAEKALQDMRLVKQSRLSVSEVTKDEFAVICAMAQSG